MNEFFAYLMLWNCIFRIYSVKMQRKAVRTATIACRICKTSVFWQYSFNFRRRLMTDEGRAARRLPSRKSTLCNYISGAMTFRIAPARRDVSLRRFTSCIVTCLHFSWVEMKSRSTSATAGTPSM